MIQREPLVRVIAHTKFLGVPLELQCKGMLTGQDQGSELARYTECAGRACYDSYGTGRVSQDYHPNLRQQRHGSVLEHATIGFYLEMSRGCSHEWVRHRAGCAISQRSTRFCDESESDYLLHPLILQVCDETELSSIRDEISRHRDMYRQLVSKVQSSMEARGVERLTARKQARGAARGILGNALTTSMVWTGNIRAIRNVIEQRATPWADAEIRLLAYKVWEQSIQVCPEWFADYEEYPSPDGVGYCLKTDTAKI
jgi:thymidylate synthase (FAD)